MIRSRSTAMRMTLATRLATLAVFLTTALLAASSARADNPTGQVTAVCRAGQGCRCSDGVDPADVIWAHYPERYEERLPEGWAGDLRAQTVVIDLGSGQVFRSGQPRAAINAAYGGSGPCEPEPRPQADIVPRDGIWRWRTLGETVQGCPAMLSGLLAGMRVDGLSRTVSWGGAFHPDRLAEVPMQDGMGPFVWRRLGPNRWLSDNIDHRECSEGSCLALSLRMSMQPASPERVSGLLVYRSQIDAAGAGAILAQLGMADCQVRLRYEIRRIGG